jgi:hypothetical protein
MGLACGRGVRSTQLGAESPIAKLTGAQRLGRCRIGWNSACRFKPGAHRHATSEHTSMPKVPPTFEYVRMSVQDAIADGVHGKGADGGDPWGRLQDAGSDAEVEREDVSCNVPVNPSLAVEHDASPSSIGRRRIRVSSHT